MFLEPLTVGAYLIYAGRRWRILSVDDERRVIDLAPAGGGRLPRFEGSGFDIRPPVRKEMRRVYVGTDMPAFLDTRARNLLSEARSYYRRYGLTDRRLLSHGVDTVLFFWSGDREAGSLRLLLAERGMAVTGDGFALTVAGRTPGDVITQLAAIAAAPPADPLALAATVANKQIEKHDRFLSDDLLRRDYAARMLDTVAAKRLARSIASGILGN